jgi:4-hydroxythreonine-4-phosphate dehydrogenase
MLKRFPRLAVPLGDPAGIGPEVILKALADPRITQTCEVVVVGSRSQLDQTHAHLRQIAPDQPLAHPDHLTLVDPDLPPELTHHTLGQATAASGEASFRYLTWAIDQAIQGHMQGIVTGPIAKSAWKAAGHLYPGQTELLAEKAGVTQFGMAFVARSPHTDWMLRTLLATTHIPLRQVADTLTPTLMSHKLDLLVDCLQRDFGLEKPTIEIAGLNPHSGEQGQLGREEVEWLSPWMAAMGDRHPQVTLIGPVPPDTLWVKPGQAWFGTGPFAPNASGDRGAIADAYLALYHDQGLIPVKLMAFDRAVNTTIGLPFVRTSPDHGTAFDIAGQGLADATSMKAALQLAAELCHQRT